MVDKKINCCAICVDAGPLLLLSEGEFSELQIAGKLPEERNRKGSLQQRHSMCSLAGGLMVVRDK
jgi:hypothetical protein